MPRRIVTGVVVFVTILAHVAMLHPVDAAPGQVHWSWQPVMAQDTNAFMAAEEEAALSQILLDVQEPAMRRELGEKVYPDMQHVLPQLVRALRMMDIARLTRRAKLDGNDHGTMSIQGTTCTACTRATGMVSKIIKHAHFMIPVIKQLLYLVWYVL